MKMPEILIQKNIFGGFQVLKVTRSSERILKDCMNEAEAVKWRSYYTGQLTDNQLKFKFQERKT